MITDYKFNTTGSPDAKLNIDNMDVFQTDKTARGKSFRDKNLIKVYFDKRAILASALKTISFSENPKELCDKLKLLLQEIRAESFSNIFT